MATTTSTPEAILDAVGGAENIIHFTHCATRLRFELKDASGIDKAAVETIPGVMAPSPVRDATRSSSVVPCRACTTRSTTCRP